MKAEIRKHMKLGNDNFISTSSAELRRKTAEEGQTPYAIVICCSDSRVIPEQIFSADIGDLFVVRVAGNVLDRHQLGSIAYATEHLGCKTVVMLGHTGCGAVGAALEGHADGYIRSLTDEIQKAIGQERDPDEACRRNALYGAERIRQAFRDPSVEVRAALYDIRTGAVEWL